MGERIKNNRKCVLRVGYAGKKPHLRMPQAYGGAGKGAGWKAKIYICFCKYIISISCTPHS